MGLDSVRTETTKGAKQKGRAVTALQGVGFTFSLCAEHCRYSRMPPDTHTVQYCTGTVVEYEEPTYGATIGTILFVDANDTKRRMEFQKARLIKMFFEELKRSIQGAV